MIGNRILQTKKPTFEWAFFNIEVSYDSKGITETKDLLSFFFVNLTMPSICA